jgi:hypothetical protein
MVGIHARSSGVPMSDLIMIRNQNSLRPITTSNGFLSLFQRKSVVQVKLPLELSAAALRMLRIATVHAS